MRSLLGLTLDTTRADHLATYGYFRATTPAFDELAAESLVFERCIAPMARTLPTHLSMLTGTYPLEHGGMSNSTTGGEQFIMAESLCSPMLQTCFANRLDSALNGLIRTMFRRGPGSHRRCDSVAGSLHGFQG